MTDEREAKPRAGASRRSRRGSGKEGAPASTDRQLRCLNPEESDRLWIWVCGSREGGGFVRGDARVTAKALGITPKALNRLMEGPYSLLRAGTIRRLMNRIAILERDEVGEYGRLARLSWSEDGTARDEKGRWYVRYRLGGCWVYLTGAGEGYPSAVDARFAAAKMRVIAGTNGNGAVASTGAPNPRRRTDRPPR